MVENGVKVFIGPQHISEHSDYELISMGPPIILRHKKREFFTGRIPDLGLTVYGDTADSVVERVKKAFFFYLRETRKLKGEDGVRDWLNYAEVRWEWAESSESELVFTTS